MNAYSPPFEPMSRRDGASSRQHPHEGWEDAKAWAIRLPLPAAHISLLVAMLKCTYGGRLICCAHIDTILAKVEGVIDTDDTAFRMIRNLIEWGVIFEVPRPKGRRCRAFGFAVGAVIAKPARPKIGRPWKAPKPERLQMASCKYANGQPQTYRGKPQETGVFAPNPYTEPYPEQEPPTGTTFPPGDARARATPREEAGERIEASVHEPEAWEGGSIFGVLGDDPPLVEAAPAPEPAPEPEVAVAHPAHEPAPVAAVEIARERAAPVQPKPAPTAKRARKAKRAPRPSECAPLPAGWSPDAMQVAFAVNLGLDADLVAGAFLEHWTNTERGRKTKRADWNLSWQRWCREDAARARARGVPALRPGGGIGMGRAMTPAEEEAFESFWLAYPRKDEKAEARVAFADALRRTDAESILRSLARSWVRSGCIASKPHFIPLAKTWLAKQPRAEDAADPVMDLPDAVLHEVIGALAYREPDRTAEEWAEVERLDYFRAATLRGRVGKIDPTGTARALRHALGMPDPEAEAAAVQSFVWSMQGRMLLAGAGFLEAELTARAKADEAARYPNIVGLAPRVGPPLVEVYREIACLHPMEGVPPAAMIAGLPALLAGSAAP